MTGGTLRPTLCLLLGACAGPGPVTLDKDCEGGARTEPVSEDWEGVSEAALLDGLTGLFPTEVTWDVSPNEPASPVLISAVRTSEPARVEWPPCESARRIVVPMAFTVDVHDGAAVGAFDGVVYAWEDDDTLRIDAGGPATLSTAWWDLANAATAGGSESTHLVLEKDGEALLDIRSSGPSNLVTVWRARWLPGP